MSTTPFPKYGLRPWDDPLREYVVGQIGVVAEQAVAEFLASTNTGQELVYGSRVTNFSTPNQTPTTVIGVAVPVADRDRVVDITGFASAGYHSTGSGFLFILARYTDAEGFVDLATAHAMNPSPGRPMYVEATDFIPAGLEVQYGLRARVGATGVVSLTASGSAPTFIEVVER